MILWIPSLFKKVGSMSYTKMGAAVRENNDALWSLTICDRRWIAWRFVVVAKYRQLLTVLCSTLSYQILCEGLNE